MLSTTTTHFLKSIALGRKSIINGRRSLTLTQNSNRNFSSRIRRKKPATGKLAKKIEDESVKENKKKTEFQVKDLLESSSTGMFIPRNELGEEVTMGEYLEFATLSPWVPSPDAVARRALDIGKTCEDDIHYELGCGDGRMNFFAIDLYDVKKSVGIDIDPSMIQQSNERILRRHPAPENVSFICADLVDEKNETTREIWENIGKECTVLTMFFVEDALNQLKPLLEKHLVGKDCRILIIGYQINGWEPEWVEAVLGLTISMYDMKNLDGLYNRTTTSYEPTQEDIELNEKSRQVLTSSQTDTESNNPFANQRKKSTFIPEEDPFGIEDFDENEEFPDDNMNFPRK